MGILGRVLGRKAPESSFTFEFDLHIDQSKRIYMKRLAIEICISFLGRTISQSEFRVKKNNEYIKDILYYKLNVRPNKNQTASTFWQEFVRKLVYDNECLIIISDDKDLLIADSFQHEEFALYEDKFTNVVVKGYEFKRIFKQSEVLHLKYSNERLSNLIDGLFADYGDLFGRVLSAQKRKNQVRSTVNIDSSMQKTEEARKEFQEYINNLYEAFENKDVAIVPQQPGYEYDEKSSNAMMGQSVDEVNKVTGGFLEQVAMSIGIPVSLLRGDMADVEKQTKNYMFFTVSPFLLKIKNESDAKFFTVKEFMDGSCIDVRKPSYRDIFDLATAIDKLVSSGSFNGNEIRSEVGYDMTDEEIHEKYFITKNFQESSQALEGGEDE